MRKGSDDYDYRDHRVRGSHRKSVRCRKKHFAARGHARASRGEGGGREKPSYFRDEMVFGAFKSFSHEHRFRSLAANRTEKRDLMRIAAPLGLLGKLAEKIFLKRYMTSF